MTKRGILYHKVSKTINLACDGSHVTIYHQTSYWGKMKWNGELGILFVMQQVIARCSIQCWTRYP